MDSKIIESYQCSLERSHAVSIEHRDLMLNSNQGLALLRQKQMLRSSRHKNLLKQNKEDFSIQLLNAWLYFTNNKFLTSTYTEVILVQPIF